MLNYIIGVDLGQAQDYTAISVLERSMQTAPPVVNAHGRIMTHDRREAHYQVRHLDRLPLGTPYPQQVEAVTSVVERVERTQAEWAAENWASPAPRPPRLVVDQTGVGRPVVDMLRQAGHKSLQAVTITAGDTASNEGLNHRVPKRELVSVLQVLLQTDRLAVAGALPHAHTLTKEMLAFKVTITAKGNDTFGNDWRENPHDDLVLAVALAVWSGERGIGRPSAAALKELSHW